MFKPLGKFIEKGGVEDRKDLAFSATVTSYQMTPEQVYGCFSGAVIAGSVNLPPVVEMAGKIVCVRATSVATGNVTVYPNRSTGGLADSLIYSEAGAVASYVLATAHAFVLLYSTGDRWIQLQFDLSI